MSLPRYPTYKDSGVEWLGNVPEHWDTKRIGHYFSERREKVSDKDYPALSVTMGGIVPQIDTAAKTDDSDNRKRVCVGDFVINSRSDRKGSSGVSDLEGSVSLISIVLRAYDSSAVHMPFVHHLLRSQPFQEEFYRNGKGIVADLWSTNYSAMRNIIVAMPDSAEQAAIASFLDRETAKIDALVAEQRRLIELLKEKRQAVISHAVTKGLNPDAPMKDSGVEWLGEVPGHWATVQIKRLCSLIKDGTHLPPARVSDGIPLLSVRNLIDGCFVLRDDDSLISVESYKDLCRSFVPQVNDVILAIVGATLGKSAVVRDGLGLFHVQRSVAVFRTTTAVLLPEFLNLVFESYGFQEQLWTLVGYSAQPGIYLGTLQDLRIPVPPSDEQHLLVSTVAMGVKRIDLLVIEAQRAITLLQERRSSLISAVVTGQIDVRPAVEPDPS